MRKSCEMVEQLIPYYVKKSALKYGNHPLYTLKAGNGTLVINSVRYYNRLQSRTQSKTANGH